MTTENVIAKLAYLEDTKLAIKQAIIDKGVSFTGDENFIGYAVKIGEIPTGAAGEFLVRFIDYDGTILKEQRVNSGEAATAPPIPVHDNLTFQEWNNNFTNVTSDIDVGTTYITTDGKSHIFILLTTATGLAATLNLKKFTVDDMTINWGDGTSETVSVSTRFSRTHTYAETGDYEITIECAGAYTFGQDYNSISIFYENEHVLTKLLIGENVATIVGNAFIKCVSLQTITIPVGVTIVKGYSFENCGSLKCVVLPNGVTAIESSAFSYCVSLQTIAIPIGVTSIGSYAFRSCYTLQSIIISFGVTSIGIFGFTDCYSLKSVVLPDSIISFESYVFSYCSSLESIVIPVNMTSIPSNTFANCYTLKNVVIPIGLTSIGQSAFSSCFTLKNIELPIGLSSILITAFANCSSLQSIIIPEGCIVGTDLLEKCYSLTTITIPEGQTIIGNDFALDDKSLKSVYLPSTIISIDDDAFSGCQQLNTLEILATTPPTLHVGAFDTISKILKIYVPDDSVDAYKAATNWITYANYIYPISTRP